MEKSNRVVGRSGRIYLQTPENGTLLLGLQDFSENNNHSEVCIVQGHEVYILADSLSCDEEKEDLCPVSHLEFRVIEDQNGCRGTGQDEELTSLSWLQNTNLLQSINLKTSTEQSKVIVEKKPVQPKQIETMAESDETGSSWDGSNLSYSDVTPQVKLQQPNGDESSNNKPPHSFSTLIFLAIESSPSKALPVRDIYSWIIQHFPYYRNAPGGWKNSVRHNLSLNKCFYKVECGLNLSKGSFWMVDPLHRPQLIQSLCKVSYIKADVIQQLIKEPEVSLDTSQVKPKDVSESADKKTLPSSSSVRPNVNLPDPKLFPFLSRRLAFNTAEDPDVEVNAAKAMLSLGQSHLMNNNQNESNYSATGESSSPADDHTYSFTRRLIVKNGQRKLVGSQKRDRSVEHVPDVVRELEVSSCDVGHDSQSPQPAKWSRMSATSGRGRGRGRSKGRAKCR